jgi:hypothetical protein
MSNKLHNDDTLAERSALQAEAIMELLEFCLRSTYFQVDDKFFQQKDDMAMGSSLSLIINNIYMEHFEKLALGHNINHSCGSGTLMTFVVWPHGPEQLQNVLSHFNCLRPNIHFTMEIESDITVPLLYVLVIRKETILATKIYRKLTHAVPYFNFSSNHPLHMKRSLIQPSQKRFHNMPRMPRSM